jgi:hypothetical protein
VVCKKSKNSVKKLLYFFCQLCAIMPSEDNPLKKRETFPVYIREEVTARPFFD